MPARIQVEEAWAKREEFHASGDILYLPTPCPWKDHLFDIEAENNMPERIKFVLFPDERKMVRV